MDSLQATSSLPHSLSPSGKTRVFYNVYVDALINISRVSTIVRQQLSQLDPQRHHLQIVSNGVATDPSTLAIDDLQIVEDGGFLHIPDGQENATLQELWSYCSSKSTHPSEVVVYLHSKGSYHDTPAQAGWREYLQAGALSQECRQMPGTCNTCGSRMSPLPFAHLPGNMWAARCSYISKLIQPQLFQSAMAVVLGKRSKEPDDCPPPGGLADNCYGVGRFSNEHWVLSHPDAQPCDLDSNLRYAWGEPTVNHFMSMYSFVHNLQGEKLLHPAPRADMSAYQDVDACHACGLDISQRLLEYRILYEEEPPASWWGWKFFESKLWHFISETAAWGKSIRISSWYVPIYHELKLGRYQLKGSTPQGFRWTAGDSGYYSILRGIIALRGMPDFISWFWFSHEKHITFHEYLLTNIMTNIMTNSTRLFLQPFLECHDQPQPAFEVAVDLCPAAFCRAFSDPGLATQVEESVTERGRIKSHESRCFS